MRSIIHFVIFILFCLSANAQKNIILEKFTNTHCGICPNASLVIQDLVDEYPNTFWLSHHKPNLEHTFYNPETAVIWDDLGIVNYPAAMIDRLPVNASLYSHNYPLWFDLIHQQSSISTYATVGIKT